MSILYENYLEHHGVKGQKWGVRHDNDETGNSHQTKKQNVFQKHKSNLIQKYKDKGYSDILAEETANKRIKTEIFVGGLAAVALGVVATKATIAIGQEYCDKTIKSGKVLQNIGAYENTDFSKTPFFAAMNKHDKAVYGMNYPAEKYNMQIKKGINPKIFNNQIKVNSDMKRASVNNARKIFYDKLDNDKEFKEKVISAMKKTNYYNSAVMDYEYTGKKTRKLYDAFNQSLATPAMQNSGMHKKFYSALKDKGYDAILDINDTRYSGYRGLAKAPTIIFGDKLTKMYAKELSRYEIEKNANKFKDIYYKSFIAKYIAIAGGTSAAVTAIAKNTMDEKKTDNYVNKHPNTKKTSDEIIYGKKKK